MLKVKHNLCQDITDDIFIERRKRQYNLRNRPDFITTHVHSVFHGTESILYLGPKIWDLIYICTYIYIYIYIYVYIYRYI